jgi:inorganic triphosphatase YgiF
MKNNGLTMVKVEGELFVSKSDYDKLAASFSTLMEQLAITNEAVNRETKLANQYRDKCDKLAAECAIYKKAYPQPLGPEMMKALDAYEKEQNDAPEIGMLNAFFILRDSIVINDAPVSLTRRLNRP